MILNLHFPSIRADWNAASNRSQSPKETVEIDSLRREVDPTITLANICLFFHLTLYLIIIVVVVEDVQFEFPGSSKGTTR